MIKNKTIRHKKEIPTPYLPEVNKAFIEAGVHGLSTLARGVLLSFGLATMVNMALLAAPTEAFARGGGHHSSSHSAHSLRHYVLSTMFLNSSLASSSNYTPALWHGHVEGIYVNNFVEKTISAGEDVPADQISKAVAIIIQDCFKLKDTVEMSAKRNIDVKNSVLYLEAVDLYALRHIEPTVENLKLVNSFFKNAQGLIGLPANSAYIKLMVEVIRDLPEDTLRGSVGQELWDLNSYIYHHHIMNKEDYKNLRSLLVAKDYASAQDFINHAVKPRPLGRGCKAERRKPFVR